MNELNLTDSMSLRHRIRSLLPASMSSHMPSVSSALPMAFLLIGMLSVFLFVADRGYFYRNIWGPYSHFNWTSSHSMAIATNLSLDHHFLGFINQSVDAEGNIVFSPYNRFSPGGLLLIRLVTLPFKDDISDSIYTARTLILVFFVITAVLAYWSLCRLTSSRWIALTVTLIVFSSTPVLGYSDMVMTELMPGLSAFVFTFHSMVIFAQDGRFRQLIIKTCFALLFSWHVMALLASFILLNLAKKIIRIRKVKTVRDFLTSVVTSQHFILGVVSFGFFILILAYNIGNEYYALNVREARQLLLPNLPSLDSLFYRAGFVQESGGKTLDFLFLAENFRRITLMSVPFVWSDMPSSFSYFSRTSQIVETLNLFMGILVVGACVIGVSLVRHRLLAMTAVISGFCWAIPMYQYTIQHEFDALFYIGIPLFFYTLILLLIREWLSERFMPLGSLSALLIFMVASYRISNVNINDEVVVRFHESVVEDFNIIRKLSEGGNVLVPIGDTEEETVDFVQARYGLHYYLSGRVILFHNHSCDQSLGEADFIIRTRREVVPGLLTPDNQMMFLYDRHVYEDRIDKLVRKVMPEVRGDFNVYLTADRQLVYVSDRCDGIDAASASLDIPISLIVYPVNFGDITDSSQNFESYDLNFYEHFVLDTKRHVMVFDLPDYGITSISTGQYTGEGRIWGGRFFGPDHKGDADLGKRVDQIVASREPNIHGRFNIYLSDDRTLIYIREPCFNSDISGDFFVHVFPVDTKDLPEHRRQYEFDNLDFSFTDHGTTDGRKCAAAIDLPDYGISRIGTGQYTDEGPIWRSEFSVTDG